MADEDFDVEPDPDEDEDIADDIDDDEDEDIADDIDDETIDDDTLGLDLVVSEDAVDEEDVEPLEVAPRASAPPTVTESGETDEDDDDVMDLGEELHPDDVEEPLDVLLAERTTSDRLTEDEADLEDDEPEDRADGTTRIVPRRPNEFLCQSCFLVLPLNQLADSTRMLCRDCA